ncbi:GNAT family N-acetyltransferase [Prosthecochloris sp. N3]|uniref:GNAT family N-acetyltransferase n=1 Tax=Prosthecochloris ethylica TaxID=2743976 RepID=A0ABR9XS12_9CHLB|nr:GNAT family N-acetyltransferase [Prosthecochloris ethylica]MBF0585304.1 GNAT family N-acetyltransferase [Prosthecochloris ethylica]MBF0636840.1 GNAT family N-acetyltransferase [Prosthecochloris ethylica]NUK46533.1 GNAT family N-acetyltransferase [Prosthecochloris ethylica]
MNVRKATDEDADHIVRIFHDTVHTVNLGDYTREQVDAWSPEMPDPEAWTSHRLCTRSTFVADDNGILAGFGELERDGHIDGFYCHHQYQRQGVGSALLHRIEQEAISAGLRRLFTESSITARPFFAAHGFVVLNQQIVVRLNVELTNFLMEKRLQADTSP